MGIDSTPFYHDDNNSTESLFELFGDPFTDVTSFLDGILFEVDQRVVNELFEKISLMN